MKAILSHRSQSTLEYLIMLTAILVAVMVAVQTFAGKDSNTGIRKLMEAAANLIKDKTGALSNLR